MAGDLIVPVPGWGNFDMDSNLYFGHINFDAKVNILIKKTKFIFRKKKHFRLATKFDPRII